MSDLVKKLLIKPGYKLAVVNPPEGFLARLDPLLENSSISDKLEPVLDFVQIFVKDGKEAEKLVPQALKSLREDGVLWVSYPKGGSKVKTDLNRDILWEKLKKFGITGVAMVSIDDVWSAMRFRPLIKVGK